MGRVLFPETIDEIVQGLAGDTPGMAMWRVRQIEDRTPLYPLLEGPETNLPLHTAMALALAGDDAGAPLLVECVKCRDAFIPKTSRKYNMIRGASALYLLGRLQYKPALEEILSLIANWRTIEPNSFTPDEFIADEEEYRFQYLTQAIVAAMAIAQEYPETRTQVDGVVHSVIDAEDFSIHSSLKMTIKGIAPIKYEMAPMIRSIVRRLSEKRKST